MMQHKEVNTMNNTQLSQLRQNLNVLMKKVEKIAFSAISNKPIIKGQHYRFFKRCGKHSCKCSNEPLYQHGPYNVVQIHQEGKKRQLMTSHIAPDVLKKVNEYQVQMEALKALKAHLKNIEDLVCNIIEKRIIK